MLSYYRPKNSPTKMLQHVCISGRTNLTHTYVCFLTYTENFHHKFFYHIWYNENPYHLTPYLTTNKQYNISLQNRIDSCVIPLGAALTLLPTARYESITRLHIPGASSVAIFQWIHQLSDSSVVQSVKTFYQSTKFFLIRKLLRVPDISFYRSLRSYVIILAPSQTSLPVFMFCTFLLSL